MENKDRASEEKEWKVDENIKQAILEYLLGFVRKRHPNLSKENEEKFTTSISETIDYELKNGNHYGDSGFGPRGLKTDYNPSPELVRAIHSMDFGPDYNNLKMGAEASFTFPPKMEFVIRRGEFVKAFSREQGWKYVYMTQEYKQQKLAELNREISKQISRIPEKDMEDIQEEYKERLNLYERRRNYLRKAKQEDAKEIEPLKKELDDLYYTYSNKIDEMMQSSLLEEEKQKEKERIINEIMKKRTQYYQYVNSPETNYHKAIRYMGGLNLTKLDSKNEELIDKEQWIRKRIIEHADNPEDLERWYQEKDAIYEYEQAMKRKDEKQKATLKSEMLSEQDEKTVSAFAQGYTDLIRDVYFSRDVTSEKIFQVLKEYFANDYEKLGDEEFLRNFERNILGQFAKKFDYIKKNDTLYKYIINREEPVLKIEDGIVICESNWEAKAKVYYGDKQSVEQKIHNLKSMKRYGDDAGIPVLETEHKLPLLKALEEYLVQIYGKETTLEELDAEKARLEDIMKKSEKLEERYAAMYGDTNEIEDHHGTSIGEE